MGAALALIFASIVDIPSVISVLGAMRVKRVWQAVLVGVVAAVFGEILMMATHSAYMGPVFFPYRLIAQLIVALSVFAISSRKRAKKRKEQTVANDEKAPS